MRSITCDYLIVGAGLFGSVLAERIADELNAKVVIIDKRSHPGGNCYSEYDHETGIEFHKYGSHIFHTSSKQVWEYINRFAEFNNYRHQGLTTFRNKVYQMPVNLETINSFYNLSLKPSEAKDLLSKEINKAYIKNPKNLEEKAVSLIGWQLYEALIKGYTFKQWGMDPKDLPAEIISRLPVRYSYQEDYFLDAQWQGVPVQGYTKTFEKMLASNRIDLILNCDFFENRYHFDVREKIIYTGPIDKYFNYQYGRLGWRSVGVEKFLIELDDYQGTSIMNYADMEIKYTRIHEPKHLHPERTHIKGKTIVFYETPKEDNEEPYYPINTEQNRLIYQKYRELAQQGNKTIIGGRLGDYAYYDMDKTILAALQCYETKIKRNSRISFSFFSTNQNHLHQVKKLKKHWASFLVNIRKASKYTKENGFSAYLFYMSVKTFYKYTAPFYRYKFQIATILYNSKKDKFETKARKYLYASPVGKNGKEFLAKIIGQFGYDQFDYLIFAFDETTFSENIYNKCRIVREKGLKWEFAAKYLTEDYCRQYDFIFFWDDDIDITNFSYRNFISIMMRNNLELAQPALSHESYHNLDITLQDKKNEMGRYVDFVEIMVPVFRNDAWSKYRNMIIGEKNPWGWGYDVIAKSYCRYINMGIVDCETVVHTRPPQSKNTTAPSDEKKILNKYKNFKQAMKISYAKLK